MLSGIIGTDKSPTPTPPPAPPSALLIVAAASAPPSSPKKTKKKRGSRSDDDSSPERLKTKVIESIKKNKNDSRNKDADTQDKHVDSKFDNKTKQDSG